MTTEQIALIVVAIFGSTGFWQLMTKIYDNKQKAKTQQVNPTDIALMKDAILAILHDRLYQACRFYLSKGVVDEDGYTNLKTMYDTYHGLGGNGTGTELYNRASRLKIVENLDDETI